MTDVDERIKRLNEFKTNLIAWEKSPDDKLREWLNQNKSWVQRETTEAGCGKRLTISPPPAVGGLIMQNVDPFNIMFDRPWLMRIVPTICDILDETIGVLSNPVSAPQRAEGPNLDFAIQRGYAFVAMPMDENDHALVDVLEAIKAGAGECGMIAERVDDDERNERITDRVLESIRKAEFVIVDLSKARPNVFFEAGYAHGIGKIPIYIARANTELHFDVQDYPVIFFPQYERIAGTSCSSAKSKCRRVNSIESTTLVQANRGDSRKAWRDKETRHAGKTD
jgi:hypothetical protein